MALLMWLGELITERGVGNGMSILIFAGIIAAMPGELSTLYRTVMARQPAYLVLIIAAAIAIVVAVVYIEQGERRIPVPVSYTHLRAHETDSYLVCRLLLEKKKNSA